MEMTSSKYSIQYFFEVAVVCLVLFGFLFRSLLRCQLKTAGLFWMTNEHQLLILSLSNASAMDSLHPSRALRSRQSLHRCWYFSEPCCMQRLLHGLVSRHVWICRHTERIVQQRLKVLRIFRSKALPSIIPNLKLAPPWLVDVNHTDSLWAPAASLACGGGSWEEKGNAKSENDARKYWAAERK